MADIFMSEYDEDRVREIAAKANYREGRAEGLREGRAEGLREGRAEGLREGRAEGLREGTRDALVRVVRRLMDAQGLTLEDALSAFGATDEEREACRALM